jgi:hypothetical protein
MTNEAPLRFEVSIEEIYVIVGELEITRRKQAQQIQVLLNQTDEMSKEIEKLNGRLVKADNPE